VNNSKKLKPKKVKKDRLVDQKPITKISKPWIIVTALLTVLLIGALLFDQLYQKTILTIEGEKYKMDDLAYYFYNLESTYSAYSQYGFTWDMKFDESGATLSDVAKQDAVDLALYTEILSREAKAQGYTLTDEEKSTIKDNVKSMLDGQISEAVIKKNHFTTKYLTNLLSKSTLVERFRQDKIDALNIDEDKIKDGIAYDDFRQYDIEYLFISTKTTDDDGNSADMTEDQKKAAYDKISAVYDKAKTTEDWSTLVPEDEEELTYSEGSFIESDTTYSDEFEAMMMGMENNEVSEIYEETNGYYIVRMKNNNSDERYNTEVENAITTAENEGFDKVYEDIKTKYDYSVNEKAVKSLKMGNLTLAE
jgi:foldase protein PrsA